MNYGKAIKIIRIMKKLTSSEMNKLVFECETMYDVHLSLKKKRKKDHFILHAISLYKERLKEKQALMYKNGFSGEFKEL